MLRVLTVNVFVILAIFAAFEGGLYYLIAKSERTASGSINRVLGKLYWQAVDLIQFQPDCAQYDPQLFYTLRPGACEFRNTGFRTTVTVNSAGLRDDEASLSAPQIVVTGDSFAMGWGVEDDQAFPSLIESRTGVRTLNAAVSSYGTAREIGMLSRLDLSAMEVLVVQFCASNDDYENHAYLENGRTLKAGSEQDYLAEAAGERTASYYPFKHFANFVEILGEKVGEDGPEPGNIDASGENEVDRFLDILADAQLGPNRPVLILMEQSLYGLGRDFTRKLEASGKMAALEKKFSEIVVVDTQTLLDRQDFLFPDGHTNAGGHSKIADAVIDSLAKAGVIAPRS